MLFLELSFEMPKLEKLLKKQKYILPSFSYQFWFIIAWKFLQLLVKYCN